MLLAFCVSILLTQSHLAHLDLKQSQTPQLSLFSLFYQQLLDYFILMFVAHLSLSSQVYLESTFVFSHATQPLLTPLLVFIFAIVKLKELQINQVTTEMFAAVSSFMFRSVMGSLFSKTTALEVQSLLFLLVKPSLDQIVAALVYEFVFYFCLLSHYHPKSQILTQFIFFLDGQQENAHLVKHHLQTLT